MQFVAWIDACSGTEEDKFLKHWEEMQREAFFDAVVVKHAFQWYRELADRDNAPAMLNMGLCLANGVGCEKDAKQAGEWMRRAAALGHSRAQVHLGALTGSTDAATSTTHDTHLVTASVEAAYAFAPLADDTPTQQDEESTDDAYPQIEPIHPPETACVCENSPSFSDYKCSTCNTPISYNPDPDPAPGACPCKTATTFSCKCGYQLTREPDESGYPQIEPIRPPDTDCVCQRFTSIEEYKCSACNTAISADPDPAPAPDACPCKTATTFSCKCGYEVYRPEHNTGTD